MPGLQPPQAQRGLLGAAPPGARPVRPQFFCSRPEDSLQMGRAATPLRFPSSCPLLACVALGKGSFSFQGLPVNGWA